MLVHAYMYARVCECIYGNVSTGLGPSYRNSSSNLNCRQGEKAVSGSMTLMVSLERQIDFLQLAVELSTRYRLLGQFPRLAAVAGVREMA